MPAMKTQPGKLEKFFRLCRKDRRGAAVVEFPYAREMVLRNEWDTIYHEHLSYFLVGPFLRLAEAVAEVLEQDGRLKSREIARLLRRRGWGNPPVNAVNKVLSRYLAGRGRQGDGGRWHLLPGRDRS